MIKIEEDKGVKHTTIVLADEQPAMRQKLRLLLESEPGFLVIGEINNGLDALDMVGNLHPDILVFGLNSSNNQEIIQLINLRHPKTTIIVTYKIGNENQVLYLSGTGVKAHVLKNSTATELVEAIQYVNAHKNNPRSLHPGSITRNHTQERVKYTHDPIETLTVREHEIFDLVIHELTNVQIATQLSISRRTVEIHRAKILLKLGLRNQHQQLLSYAFERGILPQ